MQIGPSWQFRPWDSTQRWGNIQTLKINGMNVGFFFLRYILTGPKLLRPGWFDKLNDDSIQQRQVSVDGLLKKTNLTGQVSVLLKSSIPNSWSIDISDESKVRSAPHDLNIHQIVSEFSVQEYILIFFSGITAMLNILNSYEPEVNFCTPRFDKETILTTKILSSLNCLSPVVCCP